MEYAACINQRGTIIHLFHGLVVFMWVRGVGVLPSAVAFSGGCMILGVRLRVDLCAPCFIGGNVQCEVDLGVSWGAWRVN